MIPEDPSRLKITLSHSIFEQPNLFQSWSNLPRPSNPRFCIAKRKDITLNIAESALRTKRQENLNGLFSHATVAGPYSLKRNTPYSMKRNPENEIESESLEKMSYQTVVLRSHPGIPQVPPAESLQNFENHPVAKVCHREYNMNKDNCRRHVMVHG